MPALIFIIYMLPLLFAVVYVTKLKKLKSGANQERSSDGHIVPKEDSFTCETKEGHHHPKMSQSDINDFGKRYIVHDEPEDGYVVLNGVRRRLDECSKL